MLEPGRNGPAVPLPILINYSLAILMQRTRHIEIDWTLFDMYWVLLPFPWCKGCEMSSSGGEGVPCVEAPVLTKPQTDISSFDFNSSRSDHLASNH